MPRIIHFLLYITIVLFFIALGSMSVYKVLDTQEAVLKNIFYPNDFILVDQPGFHIKWPFYTVMYIDKRAKIFAKKDFFRIKNNQEAAAIEYAVQWNFTHLKLYFQKNPLSVEIEKVIQQKLSLLLEKIFISYSMDSVLKQAEDIESELLKTANTQIGIPMGLRFEYIKILHIIPESDTKEAIIHTMLQTAQQIVSHRINTAKENAERIQRTAKENADALILQTRILEAQTQAETQAQIDKMYADIYNKAPQLYKIYRYIKIHFIEMADPTALYKQINKDFFKNFSEINK